MCLCLCVVCVYMCVCVCSVCLYVAKLYFVRYRWVMAMIGCSITVLLPVGDQLLMYYYSHY